MYIENFSYKNKRNQRANCKKKISLNIIFSDRKTKKHFSIRIN